MEIIAFLWYKHVFLRKYSVSGGRPGEYLKTMENHGNRCFCIGKTCISEKIQCFWWAARRALENHGKPQFPGKYNVSGGRPGEHLESMGYHRNLRFCVIKTRFSKVFGGGVPTQNVYFSIMFQGTRLGVVSTQNIDFSIGFQGVWLRGAYPEYIIFIDFSRCSGRGFLPIMSIFP